MKNWNRAIDLRFNYLYQLYEVDFTKFVSDNFETPSKEKWKGEECITSKLIVVSKVLQIVSLMLIFKISHT